MSLYRLKQRDKFLAARRGIFIGTLSELCPANALLGDGFENLWQLLLRSQSFTNAIICGSTINRIE